MPRKSLNEALGTGQAPESPARPPFAPELVSASPPHESVDREPDRYKLTVVLDEWEHEQLERITEAVLADVRPRRVGKGWRTKVIRALLTEAMPGEDPDPATIKRLADRLRDVDR